MDRCGAGTVPFTPQIFSHAAVAVHTVVAVVDVSNLLMDLLFLSILIRLGVFPVVIVCIWTDRQPSQQPEDAEFFLMAVNKPISLSSISFAKNAAAFFKNTISFRNSLFSRFNRRFSFIES